jgi:hypothetical protein
LTNATTITNGVFVCVGSAPLTNIADHPLCITNQFGGEALAIPALQAGEYGGLTSCSSHLDLCDYANSRERLPAWPAQSPEAPGASNPDGDGKNNQEDTVVGLAVVLAVLGVAVIALIVFIFLSRKGGRTDAEVSRSLLWTRVVRLAQAPSISRHAEFGRGINPDSGQGVIASTCRSVPADAKG